MVVLVANLLMCGWTNWKYSDVRKFYIDECIRQKDYEAAVAVLKESLQTDSGLPGLVRDYRRMLKDEIVKQWRMAYENRPAMMDELSRLYYGY